jgi:aryl-phospho-beta-D-glucosidase BglC (GH1 family)
MKRTFHTLCILFLILLVGCSFVLGHGVLQGPAAKTASAASSVLEADGERSALPRLAGWTLKGLNWQLVPNRWETEAVISTIRQYGVNVIRRHFASAPVMEQGTATRAVYFRRWHTVADWCASHGLWVIFDLYSRFLGGEGTDGMRWVWEMPEPAFLELWRVIAQEMKDYGNVLLELGNEPNDYGRVTPAHRALWLQRCLKAIAVIRDAGFTGYIVIPLPEGATDGRTASRYRQQVAAVDPLDRYMWDFHYYWYHHELMVGTPSDTSLRAVQGWLDRKGIRALRASGDRVLCGEFGVHRQDPDPRDLQWFRNLLTILKRDGYDMICEGFQPGQDFPQLQGNWATTDWTTLNRQGHVYVASVPSDLTYYLDPALSYTQYLPTIQRLLERAGVS